MDFYYQPSPAGALHESLGGGGAGLGEFRIFLVGRFHVFFQSKKGFRCFHL